MTVGSTLLFFSVIFDAYILSVGLSECHCYRMGNSQLLRISYHTLLPLSKASRSDSRSCGKSYSGFCRGITVKSEINFLVYFYETALLDCARSATMLPTITGQRPMWVKEGDQVQPQDGSQTAIRLKGGVWKMDIAAPSSK